MELLKYKWLVKTNIILLLFLGFDYTHLKAGFAQSPLSSSVCDSTIQTPSLAVNATNQLKSNSQAIRDSIDFNLWWAKDQLDQLKKGVLVSWLVDALNQRLDMIVDRQSWSQLNYLQRYRLVYQLGNIARENRYNLRVFNQQNKCLVVYHCDFNIMPSQCQMKFDSPVESRFQIYTPAPGELNFKPNQ